MNNIDNTRATAYREGYAAGVQYDVATSYGDNVSRPNNPYVDLDNEARRIAWDRGFSDAVVG